MQSSKDDTETTPQWAKDKAKEYWYAIATADDPVGDLAELLARDFPHPKESSDEN